ncbi:hypothetical protein [Caryophanon tenue]|uniref:Uncharacterized protein n=1 Tax=Caryophanon tenue TaxID=33978 RepID=A0A1C0Y8L2_9BACL|nr:hypothetical protein [Caryophanon tenue]OCS83516.1 hypothetical protein A6M13_04325 [Caryophanon tenue]
MGNLFMYAAIAAVVLTLLIVPLRKPASFTVKQQTTAAATIFVLSFIITAIVAYVTKMDVNWHAFWPVIVAGTLVGALFAKGKEQLIKGILFIASLVLVAAIFSAPLWNANDKFESASMQEEVELKAFDEKQTPASVPPQYAENKMKKAFSQVPNTSFYELGDLQIQKVNDAYVYIAPVEFSGFFKWWNGDTTPGYFTMSATDSSANPKFIQAEMTYVPSAYLNKNLERYMRLEYPTLIFYGDPQLEVDEDGKPYYIRTYGNFISMRNGFDVEGIIMVDAATGETTKYALADVPAFIDGAVSPEAVSLQNSYYGNYVHGYWNSRFGKKDVKLPSDEGTEANVSPIFNEEGDMYYFTDFTSPKEGVDSMLGYALTNARTGEATYYTGNVEESYMDSRGALDIVERQFVEKEWQGEMPILYNFYGEASWLTAVLDSKGFLQNYFVVSASNPEISAYAATPNEALRLYRTALSRGGATVDGTSNAEEATATVAVTRVYKERSGEFTLVSFLAADGNNYIVSSETVPLAIYLEVGDTVTMTFAQTGEQFLPVKQLQIDGL